MFRPLLLVLLLAAIAAPGCGDDAVAIDDSSDASTSAPDAACARPCGAECCQTGQVCDSTDNRCKRDCTPSCDGRACGDDGCGGSCGGCSAGDRCDRGSCVACTPDCSNKACGSDGCGGTCGSCGPNETCSAARQCVSSCVPKSCAELGKNCGSVDDGCGKLVACGDCPVGETCGANDRPNVCGVGACTSESDAAFCARLGKNCDALSGSDNCNLPRTASCGGCAGGETCGGGGVANVCGRPACVPESDNEFCQRLARNCGQVTGTDNCNTPRTAGCGTCTGTATCGGGGVANVCGGSTCASSCPPGYSCDGSGACSGGSQTALAFDVKTVTISGKVTLNGVAPTRTCTSAAPAILTFVELTRGYSLTVNVTCDATFSFSGQLYPGTYRVTAVGTQYSNLPQGTPFVVDAALDATSNRTGLVFDVRTVGVAGKVTLNGAAPTRTCTSAAPAILHFRETTFGYHLQVPVTCDNDFSFSGSIYPGRYKVSVIGTQYSNLPQNDEYVLDLAFDATAARTNLLFDVRTVTLGGRVTLNGAAPTRTCTSAAPAIIRLRDSAQGYELQIAVTCDDLFSFTGLVYPGTYEVSVIGTQYSNLPQGTAFVVDPGLVATTGRSGLVFDVRTVTVAGKVTLNGAAPTRTCSSAAPAVLHFRETTFGYDLQVPVTCNDDFTFSGSIYPGRYRLSVIGTQYSNLPQNDEYMLDVNFDATSNRSGLVLDVRTVTLAGKVTLNGAAPTRTCTSAAPAIVHLVDAAQGYQLQIPVTCDATFSFSGRVYPGTYRVTVVGTQYSNLPQGTAFVVDPALAATADRSGLVFNVRTVRVAGTITLNGAEPTRTCTSAAPAVLTFTELEHGYVLPVSASCTATFAFDAQIYPGTYRVTISGTQYSNLPRGSPFVAVDRLVVN